MLFGGCCSGELWCRYPREPEVASRAAGQGDEFFAQPEVVRVVDTLTTRTWKNKPYPHLPR